MTAGFWSFEPPGNAASQKSLRIDVDFELEVAFGLRACGQPFPQIFRQVDIALRLHEQAEAIASLDHGEWGLGRPEHLDPFVELRDGREPAGEPFWGGPGAGG